MKISPVFVFLFGLTSMGMAEESGLRGLQGNSNGNGNGSGNGNGNGNGPPNDEDPEFIQDDQLPPGLVNNPNAAVGVDFKQGKKPKVQKLPKINKNHLKIRGLDNKLILLNLDEAQRVNVFSPDRFTPSADGTFVTDKKTGEVVPLTTFHVANDGANVVFGTDFESNLFHVRIAPEAAAEEQAVRGQVQNFQHLSMDGADYLVGYSDDDVDLTNAPSYGELLDQEDKIPDDLPSPEVKQNQGKRRVQNQGKRRVQATSSVTLFGKTCTSWDWLDVAITTDSKFVSSYPSHLSRVQAIFTEAAEIYWKESCVRLYIWTYENTVTSPNWYWESYPQYTDSSGCSDWGALDLLQWNVQNYHNNIYRDAWHMFSGSKFLDGSVIGCAYIDVCQNNNLAFGANYMTFTTSLRWQAVLFAHELGHNLGLNHLPSTNGYWVMEPIINNAIFDLHPTNAVTVNNKVVQSSSCGWF